MQFRTIAVVSLAATISAIALGTGGAQAASNIWDSSNIKDNSLQSMDVKDGTLGTVDLSSDAKSALKGATGATGQQGQQGPQGPQGDKGDKGDSGDSGLLNAYYATAFYNVGNTNAGAIATVACKNITDVAISGGVQVLGIGDTPEQIDAANTRNTPVSSSFPGRMHWADADPSDPHNYPKANRLDGWIVQFGGNAGAASDKDPEKVKVWALCVPSANITAEQTYLQN